MAGVNWRRLGELLNGMLYRYSDLSRRINLDRIFDEYESDEARLRAVVEESWHTLSWRVVIWALYCANEIDKAQQIRSYAEPLQGMLVCDPQAFYALYAHINITASSTGTLIITTVEKICMHVDEATIINIIIKEKMVSIVHGINHGMYPV